MPIVSTKYYFGYERCWRFKKQLRFVQYDIYDGGMEKSARKVPSYQY